MDVSLICGQLLQCGEGPYWEKDTGSLFWTESAGQLVFVNNKEKNCAIWKEGVHAASLTGHASGGIMCCGARGFYHIKDDGYVRIVADTFDGKPLLDINEIIADEKGRVFGGQESYKENGDYTAGFLYRIDINGEVNIVDEGLHISNGMGFSNDMSTFYLTDTIPGIIYAYDYNLADGELKNKREFLNINKEDGLPDGLAVDAEGFVWVARWFGSGLSRFDPDGKLERIIQLPFTQPTSLAFGGSDYNEIYVTSAAVKWVAALAPTSHNYDLYRGGGLYKIVQDIQGKPEYRAKV